MRKWEKYRFFACIDWPYETAVFVEATDRQSASAKISKLLGTLYGCPPDDVSFYNLDSYTELMDEKGINDDLDFRPFKLGWNANGVRSWAESPLFLAPVNNVYLLGIWGRLQRYLDKTGIGKLRQMHPRM